MSNIFWGNPIFPDGKDIKDVIKELKEELKKKMPVKCPFCNKSKIWSWKKLRFVSIWKWQKGNYHCKSCGHITIDETCEL